LGFVPFPYKEIPHAINKLRQVVGPCIRIYSWMVD